MDDHRVLVDEVQGMVGFGRAGIQRKFHVVVGNTYRVDQINPRASKNRGRLCTVESITDFRCKSNDAGKAIVRWHDTHRSGKVDCGDLVPE